MPANPTPEELAAWRALCEKATAGPWTSEGLCLSDSSRGTFISDEQFYPWVAWTEADAAFCAAARTALPRLIDALEASEAKVRDLGQALTDIKQDVAENYRSKGY